MALSWAPLPAPPSISTFYNPTSLTAPNWPLGWAENNEALISSNIITSSSHLMAAVTVGHQEKNEQSVVSSMPFTSLHQRLECKATHSILAGWFNPFSPPTGSKHHIRHNLSLVTYNPILLLLWCTWAFRMKMYYNNGKLQNIICLTTPTVWDGHTQTQILAAHLSYRLLKWD